VTPAPAQRAGDVGVKLLRQTRHSALALSVLIYAAWWVSSAVVIVLLGRTLAPIVARALVLDRVHARAGTITVLAAVAGLCAPAVVTRLRTRVRPRGDSGDKVRMRRD
jgi:hypothetical protein